MTAWPSVYVSTTIVASPALAAETIVGQVAVTTDAASLVAMMGFITYTVGTTGTAGRLRIRADSLTGTVVADSGALTATAANVVSALAVGSPAAAEIASRLFVMTLQVTAATAASTLTSLLLLGIAQF